MFFISCSQNQEDKIILEKGISFELAKYRKKQISEVVYTLHFKIPKEKKLPIYSRLEISQFFCKNELLLHQSNGISTKALPR